MNENNNISTLEILPNTDFSELGSDSKTTGVTGEFVLIVGAKDGLEVGLLIGENDGHMVGLPVVGRPLVG